MFLIRTICFLVLSMNVAHAWDIADLRDESLSPFTTSARNVVYVGVGVTATLLIFEDDIRDPAQKMFTDHKPLGDLSKIGDLAGQFIPNAAYVIGQSIAGAFGDKDAYPRAVGMLKASAYSTAITTTLKNTIKEKRPIHKNENDSFPSGHSTSAFAFAGYVYEEHGWKWGVPALGLATLVGASRINDNRHYLHDVLAGATIGLAFGIGIAKVDREKPPEERPHSDFTIMPIIDWNVRGVSIAMSF